MTETGQNFTMWSGDTKVIEVTITDASGNAVNLTGATISYVLQRSVGSTVTISKTTASGISITDASGGVFQITLDASDTARLSGSSYYHECQITDTSGNVSTVFTGTVTMKEDAI